MSSRTFASVFPLQPPSSLIFSSMKAEAEADAEADSTKVFFIRNSISRSYFIRAQPNLTGGPSSPLLACVGCPDLLNLVIPHGAEHRPTRLQGAYSVCTTSNSNRPAISRLTDQPTPSIICARWGSFVSPLSTSLPYRLFNRALGPVPPKKGESLCTQLKFAHACGFVALSFSQCTLARQ